jgi:hypothetical protein
MIRLRLSAVNSHETGRSFEHYTPAGEEVGSDPTVPGDEIGFHRRLALLEDLADSLRNNPFVLAGKEIQRMTLCDLLG